VVTFFWKSKHVTFYVFFERLHTFSRTLPDTLLTPFPRLSSLSLVCGSVFHLKSLSPSSVVVLNHISSRFLRPKSITPVSPVTSRRGRKSAVSRRFPISITTCCRLVGRVANKSATSWQLPRIRGKLRTGKRHRTVALKAWSHQRPLNQVPRKNDVTIRGTSTPAMRHIDERTQIADSGQCYRFADANSKHSSWRETARCLPYIMSSW